MDTQTLQPQATSTRAHDVALNSMRVGQTAVISNIKKCSPDLIRKLVCMGLVAGSTVTVTQRGLFGSPINVRLFGSVVSLRSAEAAQLEVVPLG